MSPEIRPPRNKCRVMEGMVRGLWKRRTSR